MPIVPHHANRPRLELLSQFAAMKCSRIVEWHHPYVPSWVWTYEVCPLGRSLSDGWTMEKSSGENTVLTRIVDADGTGSSPNSNETAVS